MNALSLHKERAREREKKKKKKRARDRKNRGDCVCGVFAFSYSLSRAALFFSSHAALNLLGDSFRFSFFGALNNATERAA